VLAVTTAKLPEQTQPCFSQRVHITERKDKKKEFEARRTRQNRKKTVCYFHGLNQCEEMKVPGDQKEKYNFAKKCLEYIGNSYFYILKSKIKHIGIPYVHET